MSKLARQRGHQFERDTAKRWRKLFPEAMTSRAGNRAMDALGVDIINVEPFMPQCKRGRKYVNPNKIEEVQVDGVPLLHTRGDEKETIVCLYEKDFFKLLEAIGKDELTQLF